MNTKITIFYADNLDDVMMERSCDGVLSASRL